MVAELADPEAISREAVRCSVREMARYMQAVLGQKVVAYVCGLKDPKMVGHWASGKTVPRSHLVEVRLRHAYEVVRLIADTEGPTTARSWLFGSNTRLDGEAPAYLLRHATTPDDLRLIVPTARAFVAGAF